MSRDIYQDLMTKQNHWHDLNLRKKCTDLNGLASSNLEMGLQQKKDLLIHKKGPFSLFQQSEDKEIDLTFRMKMRYFWMNAHKLDDIAKAENKSRDLRKNVFKHAPPNKRNLDVYKHAANMDANKKHIQSV